MPLDLSDSHVYGFGFSCRLMLRVSHATSVAFIIPAVPNTRR
jgi:hypothetical protein